VQNAHTNGEGENYAKRLERNPITITSNLPQPPPCLGCINILIIPSMPEVLAGVPSSIEWM